jgi:hypothetical protein
MRALAIIGFLAAASTAQAQSGAAWLGYSTGARNLAEAGGLGSMAQGADGLGLNPAALADLSGNGEVDASYSLWPGDISVQHGEAAVRTGLGVLGVHGSWVDFGNIGSYAVGQTVEATGGSTNPHASDVGLGLGGHISRLALGVSGHMVMQDLTGQGTSSVMAFDAGARMDLLPTVTAAVSLLNLGGSLDGSSLPTAVRGGLAVRAAHDGGWELGVEASDPLAGGGSDFLAAFRYQVARVLTLRTGWLQGQGITGAWSMGVSFQLGVVGLDYGFRQMSGFDPINSFTLSLLW